jgi:hypothetical protein
LAPQIILLLPHGKNMKLYRFIYACYRQVIDLCFHLLVYKSRYASNVLNDLQEKGWSNISSIITDKEKDSISKIQMQLLAEVEENFDSVKGRIYDFHKRHHIDAGLMEKMSGIAKEYFNDSDIEMDQTQFQLSRAAADFTPLGYGWHVDDHRRILKFFLYLTPVNESNGAMSYIPGSHNKKHFRRKFLWDFTKQLSYTYFDDISPYDDNDKIKLTGSSYSFFAVDTSGFHTANPLLSGTRTVMVFNFRETRFDFTG